MQKGIYVKDISPYTEIEGIFLIANPVKLKSKRGPYWKLQLVDATGCIESKIWHPYSSSFETLPDGAAVSIKGSTDLYGDKIQLAVDELVFLNDEQIGNLNQTDFLPSSPYELDELYRELENLYRKEITYPPLRKFIYLALNDEAIQTAFKMAPAAKSIHQAYLGGLLEHSLGVAKLCMAISDLYPELDRQLLLAAAIFHDLGKIKEYSWNLSIEYTTQGNLLGHMLLGLQLLDPFLEKSRLDADLADHFKHLILSHHGEYDFGSPKLPATPEAFVLHFADNLDSKIALYKNASENLEPGQWTEWQRPLERSLFKPVTTPVKKESPNKNDQDPSCLSLLKE